MRKLKVFTVITVMVLIVSGTFNACQKEADNKISSDDNSLIQKHAGGYYTEDGSYINDSYPFVLPEHMFPFKYAMYMDDSQTCLNVLSNTLMSTDDLNFVMRMNDGLINYGWLYEDDIEYWRYKFDPKNPNDEPLCNAVLITKDLMDLYYWALAEQKKGLCVSLTYDKEMKAYVGISFECPKE